MYGELRERKEKMREEEIDGIVRKRGGVGVGGVSNHTKTVR